MCCWCVAVAGDGSWFLFVKIDVVAVVVTLPNESCRRQKREKESRFALSVVDEMVMMTDVVAMMMMSVLMASTNVSPHRPGGDGNVRRQRRHDGRRRCAQRARDLVQRRRAGARGHVLEDADTARGGLFTEDGDSIRRDAPGQQKQKFGRHLIMEQRTRPQRRLAGRRAPA